MLAEEIVSRVLYRDGLMLVIDKPAGLPVHPGPRGGETLFHHLDALRFGLPRRPEVAHRLRVHPQTVRYRLHQLEDLFGDALTDPQARFELEIALRAAGRLLSYGALVPEPAGTGRSST